MYQMWATGKHELTRVSVGSVFPGLRGFAGLWRGSWKKDTRNVCCWMPRSYGGDQLDRKAMQFPVSP